MSDTTTMTEQEILEAIQSEVAGNKVFLYMKGTPEMPRCGFSNQVVQILNHLGVEYGARDILVDPRIRQVLSGWSDWPTIPQLFVDGKLVGGCDIVTEMFQEGELQPLVGAEANAAS
jgi:monothiol glutaredoxin